MRQGHGHQGAVAGPISGMIKCAPCAPGARRRPGYPICDHEADEPSGYCLRLNRRGRHQTGDDGTIANFATIVKLEFLRKSYFPNTALSDLPAEDISRLLMMTHSVRHGEPVLAGAGYKVTGARITMDGMGDLMSGSPVRAWTGFFQSTAETAEDFMKRHGINPDDEAESFFTIVLDIEPF